MDNFNALIALIQADVPKCPKIKLKQALRRTVREFCRGTRAWQETTREFLPGGLSQITLGLPQDGELLELRSVKVGNDQMTIFDEVPVVKGEGRPRAVGVSPEDGDYLLAFDMTPAGDLELQVTAAYMPGITSDSIPHILTQHWGEDIAAGATAYLLFQPGTSWGDPQRAQAFRTQFDRAITRARSQQAKGMAQSNQTVQMPRW